MLTNELKCIVLFQKHYLLRSMGAQGALYPLGTHGDETQRRKEKMVEQSVSVINYGHVSMLVFPAAWLLRSRKFELVHRIFV